MNEEGLFDTTKNSMRILAAQINQFRRLNKDDLACIRMEEEKEKEELKEKAEDEMYAKWEEMEVVGA